MQAIAVKALRFFKPQFGLPTSTRLIPVKANISQVVDLRILLEDVQPVKLNVIEPECHRLIKAKALSIWQEHKS